MFYYRMGLLSLWDDNDGERTYESLEEKTYLAILHEDGHPKFAGHPLNKNGAHYVTIGHVEWTIMDANCPSEFYDETMKQMLINKHGYKLDDKSKKLFDELPRPEGIWSYRRN